MKFLVVVTGFVSLLMLSSGASADGRYWGSYDRFFEIGISGGDFYRGPRGFRGRGNGYRRPFNRRFDRHYRPYFGYRNHRGYRRHRYDRFDTGALLGGLVLGSVLGNSIAASRYDSRVNVAPVNSRVRVIRRSPVAGSVLHSQRRLLRDLQGRCYEITRTASGRELRTELAASACNF